MSDHHTSYTVNSMIGRLFLKNQAFQSLNFEGQQSIVLDLLQELRHSDVNIGEILSDECFSDYEDTDERRTIATIFKICSYCGKAKADVKDYSNSFYKQGLCSDCSGELG
ncbi:MAG TPA: hypothetical protein V6D19_16220 [Stenomitos sp.]